VRPPIIVDYIDNGRLGPLSVAPSAGHRATQRPIPEETAIVVYGLLVCYVAPPHLELYSWQRAA